MSYLNIKPYYNLQHHELLKCTGNKITQSLKQDQFMTSDIIDCLGIYLCVCM